MKTTDQWARAVLFCLRSTTTNTTNHDALSATIVYRCYTSHATTVGLFQQLTPCSPTHWPSCVPRTQPACPPSTASSSRRGRGCCSRPPRPAGPSEILSGSRSLRGCWIAGRAEEDGCNTFVLHIKAGPDSRYVWLARSDHRILVANAYQNRICGQVMIRVSYNTRSRYAGIGPSHVVSVFVRSSKWYRSILTIMKIRIRRKPRCPQLYTGLDT